MGREELLAALDELTAALAERGDDGPDEVIDVSDEPPSRERAARMELLEELRGL